MRMPLDKKSAATHVAAWTDENIGTSERERFMEIAESELLAVREIAFARYQIKPSEFAAWCQVWERIG